MSDERVYSPPPDFAEKAWVPNLDRYREEYERSVKDPEAYWSEVAERFYWKQKWNKVRSFDFTDKIDIRFFEGARTNITYNCLDRHLESRGDKVALLWEGNKPGEDRKFTYRELHAEVCKFANVLKAKGIKKGDRVSIYMPMVPELAIAMLAARASARSTASCSGGSAPSRCPTGSWTPRARW